MKRVLCAVIALALMAVAVNGLAQASGLFSKDEQGVIHFCDLPWDADLNTVVETIEAATGLEAWANGDSIQDGLLFLARDLIQLPELSGDCYLVLIGLGSEEDGSWWVECQLVPDQAQFGSATQAANLFFDVNFGFMYSLDIDKPDGIQVSYPQDYAGDRAIENQETYGEILDTWVKTVDEEGVCASLAMFYGNAMLSLESMELEGNATLYSCWLMLYPN